MVMPGGVIQRVSLEPLRTEYLSLDDPPTWSENRDEAFFFERYDGESADGTPSATAFAEILRKATGDHVFPAVRTKPIPHRGSLNSDCGIEDFTAARSNDREASESASMIESSTRAPSVTAPARANLNSRRRLRKNSKPQKAESPNESSRTETLRRLWYREGAMA